MMTAVGDHVRETLASEWHFLLWFIAWWLYTCFAGMSLVFYDQIRGRRVVPLDTVELWLALLVFLIALHRFWRPYLFLPPDLIRLLTARGGRVVKRRWRRPQVEMQCGPFLITGAFESPVWSHSPRGLASSQIERRRARERAVVDDRGTLDDFLERSRVTIILGEACKGMSSLQLEVRRPLAFDAISCNTGNRKLDQAISVAAAAFDGHDRTMRVSLTICPTSVTVAVVGGTWLGLAFQGRIVQALDFSERLLQALTEAGMIKVMTASNDTHPLGKAS